MTSSARQILALFVFARRQHQGLSAGALERDYELKPGTVDRVERRMVVNQRDRFVLAAFCKIEGLEGLS